MFLIKIKLVEKVVIREQCNSCFQTIDLILLETLEQRLICFYPFPFRSIEKPKIVQKKVVVGG